MRLAKTLIVITKVILFALWTFSATCHGESQPPFVGNAKEMGLTEAVMWKFFPEEEVVITHFPCSIVSNACERFKVKDAIYAAYFPDGFVLKMSSSGKVLEHYYNPSKQNELALRRNKERYLWLKFESLPEEIRKRLKIRINDMNDFFMDKYDLRAIINSLHLGKYNETLTRSTEVINQNAPRIGLLIRIVDGLPVIEKVEDSSSAQKAGLKGGDRILKINGQSTAGWDLTKVVRNLKEQPVEAIILTIERKGWDKPKDVKIPREVSSDDKDKALSPVYALRALAEKELGENDLFFIDTEKSFSLDSNNEWAKRAMAIGQIEKGGFNEALNILSGKKEGFDHLLEAIVYAKIGDVNRAIEAYSQIGEDFFEAKSVFLQKYITHAKYLLRPYKEARLNSAKEDEAKGQYKEAIKKYREYLKLADEKETKEIRSHIADVMVKYPQLFILPEEARKIVIRAETYTSDGHFEKAVEEYKKALKIQPFFPALYKALALNYAQLKNYGQAIKNMSIYLELYPDAPDARAAKDEIYRWELKLEQRE